MALLDRFCKENQVHLHSDLQLQKWASFIEMALNQQVLYQN
jgi:hypothetical protein